jgi:hypothetical protein
MATMVLTTALLIKANPSWMMLLVALFAFFSSNQTCGVLTFPNK